MSNIRLKTIVVEASNNPLIIKNGNVSITDSTASLSVLSGALNIAGGVAISCSYYSVSSTSGGALSIGGGIAVNKQAYFGGNLTLDNSSSTITMSGISTPRMFLDSVSNKNFYLSVDGVTKRFNLHDTTLLINITTPSSNATSGALCVAGGLSIASTVDMTNTSNGGALTVGGGASFGGNVGISKSLTVGQDYSGGPGLLVRYTGTSQIALENSSESTSFSSSLNMNGNDMYISNNNNIIFVSTGGSVVFQNSSTGYTMLSVNSSSSVFEKYVSITDTIASLGSTTGSLLVSGGISTACTTDAASSTSGGSITTSGGISVLKKTYTGDSIGVELNNENKNNKIMLYQSSQDLESPLGR